MCMHDWLVKVLRGHCRDGIDTQSIAPPLLQADLCSQRARGQDHLYCKHAGAVFKHLIGGEVVTVVEACGLLQRVLAIKGAQCCGAVRQWQKDLFLQLCCLMDEGWKAQLWPADPGDLATIRGRQRRMRLDADHVEKPLTQMVKKKRFRSTALAVRGGAIDASRRSARELEEENAMKYAHSTSEMFQDEARLTFAADESVVGGEPTMVGALCSWKTRKAVWTIQQVHFLQKL